MGASIADGRLRPPPSYAAMKFWSGSYILYWQASRRVVWLTAH